VGKVVVMSEGRGLELPGVADKSVTVLADEILAVGGTVKRLETMLGGGELELEVSVTFGD
jgi:hypothetical protein